MSEDEDEESQGDRPKGRCRRMDQKGGKEAVKRGGDILQGPPQIWRMAPTQLPDRSSYWEE